MNKTPTPATYAAAADFLRRLRQYDRRLTRSQMSKLRWQAITGDVDGAVRELGKMLLNEKKDDA